MTPDWNSLWFLACESAALGTSKPLALSTLGINAVLFRDASGRAVALEDRCIHRHVALSLGSVCGGKIVCPYHGLQFDGAGQCKHAPSVVSEKELPKRAVKSFTTAEQDGSVWICFGEEPAAFVNPWPDLGPEFKQFELNYSINASVSAILENFVDCSHTGFVHRGLFRGTPENLVDVVVSRDAKGVAIETLGETKNDSLLSKILNPKGVPTVHVDWYQPPFAVRVDYQFGRFHLVTVSICRPLTEFKTAVTTRTYLKAGAATKAILAVLKPYTKKILAQDVVILENQAAQVQRYAAVPDTFLSTDGAVIAVLRSYKDALAGKTLAEPSVRRFQMRL